MYAFDIRNVSLRSLNSMTKYPSIPTYHALDPKNGMLKEEAITFTGQVVATEKVNGASARIILLPDGNWIIGSREELLHARGDLIANPALGIVDAIRELAESVRPWFRSTITVLYLEVYGGGIGQSWRSYTRAKDQVGYRLFDVMDLVDYNSVLHNPIEQIALWRDYGHQPFLGEKDLTAEAKKLGLGMVPRLFKIGATELPTEVEETHTWLSNQLPQTRVALEGAIPGRSEGIVLRSMDRSLIAKARFEDYDRTLRRRDYKK